MPSSVPTSIKSYINGQFIDTSNAETFPAINPATGEAYAEVTPLQVSKGWAISAS